jgi:hypothetical protein
MQKSTGRFFISLPGNKKRESKDGSFAPKTKHLPILSPSILVFEMPKPFSQGKL